MRVLVLGNARKSRVQQEADRLLPFLREHAEVATVDLIQQQELSACPADLALVLGGDGAILRAARQMGYCQLPVLGVNLGKLGFLADLTPEDLRQYFPRVVRGEYRITRHLMFECTVETPEKKQTFLGLNEVVIHTGPSFHMIELDLSVDGEKVTQFAGDGLILSTPVGSTGHNLSAGGPILSQELSVFAITPICPHTLTIRPVVDSADKIYTIVLVSRFSDTFLIVDGQEKVPLTEVHRVTVKRAPVCFELVKVPGRSYYQALRDKLRWGTLPGYRVEQQAKQ
jgi:NAD+ kinase